MGFVEEHEKMGDDGMKNESIKISIKGEDVDSACLSRCSTGRESNIAACRVCQCSESDSRGDAALGFLNIVPPVPVARKASQGQDLDEDEGIDRNEGCGKESKVIEFVSPNGEIFICNVDIEKGLETDDDARCNLIDLGCSCKNELSLAHYACALKWFITHGSTDCEICGSVAKNVRVADYKKVKASLSDYETLIEKTGAGEPTVSRLQTNLDVDPDAVAAIRRQRLSEISLWFNPCTNSTATVIETDTESVSVDPIRGVLPVEHPATKWAVEGTGILVATGLLTVTLAWLIAPHVGEKTASYGVHILLGGVCALTVVVFLRFVVLTRITYGPARYWAILFVFWFLVFAIWASRAKGEHSS